MHACITFYLTVDTEEKFDKKYILLIRAFYPIHSLTSTLLTHTLSLVLVPLLWLTDSLTDD